MICRRWIYTVLLAVGLAWVAAAAKPAQLTVQVRTGQLRDTPSYLGREVATVAYGAQVDVLAEKGDWVRVQTKEMASGWINKSALTEKRYKFSAGSGDVRTGASADELALAGKGFNSSVESAFRRGDKKLDYAWVDKMEQIKIPGRDILQFLASGGLSREVTHE